MNDKIAEIKEELLEKAEKAKSTEELMEIAKEGGIELTEQEAQEYFDKLCSTRKHGELSDEELDNVSGGGCGNDYEYQVGDLVWVAGGCGIVERYVVPGAGILEKRCSYANHTILEINDGYYTVKCVGGHIYSINGKKIKQLTKKAGEHNF